MTDEDLKALLTKATIAAPLKATVWDLYQQSPNEDDLAKRLQDLDLPKSLKADLWDLKAKGTIPDVAPGSTPPVHSSAVPAMAGAAAGAAIDAARAVGINGPQQLVGKFAGAVAQSPAAQKVIGGGVGATTAGLVGKFLGAPAGATETAGAYVGTKIAPWVKSAAQYVASKTTSTNIPPTVGRNSLGQFTKLAKLGRFAYSTGLGAVGAESDALSRLNDPASLAELEQLYQRGAAR